MPTITPLVQQYTVDFASNNNFLFVKGIQGDGHSTRYVDISLMNNGQPYTVNNEAVTVVIRGTKPDTSIIFNRCEILDSNTIRVEITQQMSAVAGRGNYEISVMSNTENRTLTSFPFFIIISKSSFDMAYVVSSNEFGLLVEKINQVRQIQAEVTNAENIRNTNENNRIKAENARNTAETTRNTNENTRKSNENTRKSNENTRIDNENKRKTAETNRATAETDRNTAEATRNTNENTRKSNENTRIDNENKRKTAEANRVKAENTRNTKEQERKDAEIVRQFNEDTRKAQETKRQTDTADAIARTNTAITNTNTQADYAKTQGDYAKEQGNYAKEQGNKANTAASAANDIKNELIEMRDNGVFKGDKGDPGRDGVITTIDINQLAFEVIDGHLILTYETGNTDAEKFLINSNGHLIYTITA